MGWGLKIGLFFIALVAATFGAWIITIPLLLLLFLPPILNRRGNERRGRKESPSREGGTSIISIMGALLILLSVVAFFSGGTLSPIVLLVGGLAPLLRRHVSSPVSARVAPVENSILLRHRLTPYRWSVLAEAKVATRDFEGAMSGVNERLFFTSDPKPRIFLVFTANSLRRASAEESLIKCIQASTRSLVPLGVYLLPLDGAEAAGVVAVHASRTGYPTQNILQHISTADYGAVVVEAEHGFVTRFETYSRSDGVSKAGSILSSLKTENTSQLTLREFLHEARGKLGNPQPDRYAAFLGSMAATEGESLGQRITEAVQGSDGQALLVTTVGNPSVELSRAQLHAIARIYE